MEFIIVFENTLFLINLILGGIITSNAGENILTVFIMVSAVFTAIHMFTFGFCGIFVGDQKALAAYCAFQALLSFVMALRLYGYNAIFGFI